MQPNNFYINHQKKETRFFHAVSQIITEEINNSNVALTTVTEVKLSRDGSHLKVFVTFEKKARVSFQYLNHATGFVRTQLAKRIKTRKIPEIKFIMDTTFEKGRRVDQILDALKKGE